MPEPDVTTGAGLPGHRATGTHFTQWAAHHAPASDWFGLLGPPRLETDTAATAGWVRCLEQLDDLVAWVDRTHAWLDSVADRPLHRSVATTYVTGWYLDVLARTAAGWFVGAGVLPELTPEQTWLRRDLWPEASRIGAGFACTPEHELAGAATCVAPRERLLGELGRRTRTHAGAFFDGLGDGVRASSRQRWGMLDDLLRSALTQAAARAGDRFGGLTDAVAVTGSSGGVLRRSCCFAVQVSPTLECTRCPRRARGTG